MDLTDPSSSYLLRNNILVDTSQLGMTNQALNIRIHLGKALVKVYPNQDIYAPSDKQYSLQYLRMDYKYLDSTPPERDFQHLDSNDLLGK